MNAAKWNNVTVSCICKRLLLILPLKIRLEAYSDLIPAHYLLPHSPLSFITLLAVLLILIPSKLSTHLSII
jgi:hypothetical protein